MPGTKSDEGYLNQSTIQEGNNNSLPNIHVDPNLSKTHNSKLEKVLTNFIGIKSPTFTNYSVEATSDKEKYECSVNTKIG